MLSRACREAIMLNPRQFAAMRSSWATCSASYGNKKRGALKMYRRKALALDPQLSGAAIATCAQLARDVEGQGI